MHLLRRYTSLLIASWLLLGLLTACSSNSLQISVSPTATLQLVLAGGEPILPHSQIHFHDAPLPTAADLTYDNSDWTLPGHDTTSTRSVMLLPCCNSQTPGPLWFHSLGTPLLSAPVVGNHSIYLLAADGYLHVLDVGTGGERWRVAVGGELSANGLALAHGMVYVARDGHFIVALDAKNGQERWRFDMVGLVRAAPLVVG